VIVITLGEKIKEIRIQNGMTQEMIAEHLDVSRQTVTKWENNQSKPSTENMLALTELFSVSLDYLIGNKNEKKSFVTYPLIVNLSTLGYVLWTNAISLYYISKTRGTGFSLALIFGVMFSVAIIVRTFCYKSYYKRQFPIRASLIEYGFYLLVFFLPLVPIPNGFNVLFMQVVAVFAILVLREYIFKATKYWREHRYKK
jgi:transcriptional regulator with XRE-family HTH domain